MTEFYKLRKGRILCGVLAGIADKYSWDPLVVRLLFAIFAYFSHGFAVFLYLLLAFLLPYKDIDHHKYYHKGHRRRKDADVIDVD